MWPGSKRCSRARVTLREAVPGRLRLIRHWAALALWRGEPLADVESETLALHEVPRLAEFGLQVVELRIDAELRLGRYGVVIAELELMAAAHPLREHLHALLMRALYRDGRQAEALAAYQHARRVVVDELGAEPGAELRELHRQILATGPVQTGPETGQLPPGGARPAGVRPGPVVPRELPGPVPQFVGRAAELADLTGMLERASARRPRTLVISAIAGMAGVGKTALAMQWAHQVADRFPDGQLHVNLRGMTLASPCRPLTPWRGSCAAWAWPSRISRPRPESVRHGTGAC